MNTKKQHEFAYYSSPVGRLCLVANDQGLAGVFFDLHAHHQHDADWIFNSSNAELKLTALQLDEYFAGQRQQFDVPLAPSVGTAFQLQVWEALRTIPYGETWSYKQLALAIGNPNAIRAVGAANGRNPLSIIVPCHRVIASSGALQGYAGGVAQKVKLLELENLHFAQ